MHVEPHPVDVWTFYDGASDRMDAWEARRLLGMPTHRRVCASKAWKEVEDIRAEVWEARHVELDDDLLMRLQEHIMGVWVVYEGIHDPDLCVTDDGEWLTVEVPQALREHVRPGAVIWALVDDREGHYLIPEKSQINVD